MPVKPVKFRLPDQMDAETDLPEPVTIEKKLVHVG